MAITKEHVTGFAVGVGVAAVGFYLYKKNQQQIDQWLRSQGINLPEAATKEYANMTLKDLVSEKERIEDLIAERELAEANEPEASKTPSAESAG